MAEKVKAIDPSFRPRRWRLAVKRLGLAAIVGVCLACWYVLTHPLVFNESFFSHAHCMQILGTSLRVYASDHDGAFPTHTNGYGEALLLLLGPTDYAGGSAILTGPGFSGKIFDEALATGGRVPESECGRVYVQGLKENSNPEIAVVWDKLPSPGGDHSHLTLRLLRAPLREVCLVDGSMIRVLESQWEQFSKNQIELLVAAGIPRERAVALYAEKAKR